MYTQYQSALTPEDIAQILKLSKVNVYRKIKTGEIPAKKIGKEYRISRAFVWYFQTGMDFDIYEKEQIDAENIKPYETLLRSVRGK
jgi:excisionase family DNA binding protein